MTQQQDSISDLNPTAEEQLHAHILELQETLNQEQEQNEAGLFEAMQREEMLQEAVAESENEVAVLKISLAQTHDDLEEMRHQLTDARQKQSLQGEVVFDIKGEDLRRRFELAVEDLRELKTKNAELEEKLKQASSPPSLTDSTSDTLDWEAQKKRMLAQLASEFDDDDEEEREERLSIEGTIRITDQIVADREEEIAELKSQLKEAAAPQSNHEAVGANAIAALLDQDELIAQERESLKRIQDEWKDKLRKSEVEISLERAKLARERARLEETVHALQQKEEDKGVDKNNKRGKAKSSGRWLTRLGLSNDEE